MMKIHKIVLNNPLSIKNSLKIMGIFEPLNALHGGGSYPPAPYGTKKEAVKCRPLIGIYLVSFNSSARTPKGRNKKNRIHINETFLSGDHLSP